jgi:hypothetical protein
VSEFAGTIWRWAAIAALVVVGAIAVITLSFDDGEPAPASLSDPPSAREGAGGGARDDCGEVERLLSAAALLPGDICRTRKAASVAP